MSDVMDKGKSKSITKRITVSGIVQGSVSDPLSIILPKSMEYREPYETSGVWWK